MKQFLRDEFESKTVDTLEGDDVLGILATWENYLPGWEKVVISADKDLHTIPGKHWNPKRDDEPVPVSLPEADYNHLFQTLTGDPTDGFKGCPGVGRVNARRILDRPAEEHWEAVVEAYEKRGLTEGDALVQAQVARICRASDWDFTNKKVIPWTPSTPSSSGSSSATV